MSLDKTDQQPDSGVSNDSASVPSRSSEMDDASLIVFKGDALELSSSSGCYDDSLSDTDDDDAEPGWAHV